MLTKEMVFNNEKVREAIKDCGDVFKDLDFDTLKEVKNAKLEKMIPKIEQSNLYVNKNEDKYLYELMIRVIDEDYVAMFRSALIMMDDNMNIIKPANLNDLMASYRNWNKVESI